MAFHPVLAQAPAGAVDAELVRQLLGRIEQLEKREAARAKEEEGAETRRLQQRVAELESKLQALEQGGKVLPEIAVTPTDGPTPAELQRKIQSMEEREASQAPAAPRRMGAAVHLAKPPATSPSVPEATSKVTSSSPTVPGPSRRDATPGQPRVSSRLPVTIQLDRSCLLDLLAQILRRSLVTGLVPARASLTPRLAQASASQSLPSQLNRPGSGKIAWSCPSRNAGLRDQSTRAATGGKSISRKGRNRRSMTSFYAAS